MTLFRLGQFNIEIWYAPAGYKIEPHTHGAENIVLMFLFGRAMFASKNNIMGLKKAEVRFPRNALRCFPVYFFDTHWFEVSSWPLIFLNISRWRKGVKPTSASDDFQPTVI